MLRPGASLLHPQKGGSGVPAIGTSLYIHAQKCRHIWNMRSDDAAGLWNSAQLTCAVSPRGSWRKRPFKCYVLSVEQAGIFRERLTW